MKKIKGFIAVMLLLTITFANVRNVQAETEIYSSDLDENRWNLLHHTPSTTIARQTVTSSNNTPGTMTITNLTTTPLGAWPGILITSNTMRQQEGDNNGLRCSTDFTFTIGNNPLLDRVEINGTGKPGHALGPGMKVPGTAIRITQEVTWHFGNPIHETKYRIYVNGQATWWGEGSIDNRTTGLGTSIRWSEKRANYYQPLVTAADIKRPISTGVNWYDGLTATYGLTTSKQIPTTAGSTLEDTTLTGSPLTDTRLSSDGLTYNQIGAYVHTYLARDADYYNTTDLLYKDDITETTASRKISVYTTDAPDLIISYGSNADASLIGQPYDANSLIPLPCGGEDGWTNQSLDISVDPNTIPGNFDTVIKNPGDAATTVSNGIATYPNYNVQTGGSGTTVEGVLTEVGLASNELSSVVSGKVKIDTTLPVPAVSHQGGISFTDLSDDALSGKSVLRESLIALVPENATPPAKTDATAFNAITPKAPGRYDTYVWAFDKAGNEKMEKVGTFEVDGEVIIKKDTNLGATLHADGCPNHTSIEKEVGCPSNCVVGAEQGIVENTDFTYELTIENTDTTKNATGTFTDYLPKGYAETMPTPIITGTGITNTSATFINGGPNNGQWQITGNYEVAAGANTKVSIAVKAPKRIDVPDVSKVLSNKASITWKLDSSGTSTAESNYANHEITASPSVDTKFMKVGADDTTRGITGAKFALYKWTGDDTQYIGHDNDILDANELDGSEISGLWLRAKKDGEDGTTGDFFDTDVAGEVVLGELPTGIYTLIETRSPNGYELPVGQWTLVVNASNTDSGTNDWKIDYKAKSDSTQPPAVIRVPGVGVNPPTYRIVNTKPFSVGMTGMNGTAGIISIGLGLMVMAGILYSVHQRKRK